MGKILAVLFLFPVSGFSGICDKEKREYLEANKKYNQALKLSSKELNKALDIVTNNSKLLSDYSKIYDKKCKELHKIRSEKLENWTKYREENRSDFEGRKRLKKEYDKSEKKHENHCGKKIDVFLFKVYPAYKQAELKYEKSIKKHDETLENLKNCKGIEKL